MRDVYAKAERTVVWLGESRDTDDAAFEVIRQAREATKGLDYASPEAAAALASIVFEASDSENKLFNDRMETVLVSLVGRQWFERMWVIQEVVVASQVRITCGLHEIDWEDFLALFLGLVHYPRVFDSIRSLPDEQRRLLQLIQTITLIWIEYNHTPTLRLIEILRVINSHKVTDPKDRVYALLGLIRDEMVATVKIDYNLDLRGVYIQTAKCCLSSAQPFLTLSAASTSTLTAVSESSWGMTRCQGLPSWVPDFQFLDTSTPFTGHQYGFRASLDSHPSISFRSTNDEILVLHGLPIKRIRKVLSYQHHNPFLPPPYPLFIRWIIACHMLMKEASPYPTGESIDEVSWRVMICDISLNGLAARPATQVFGDFYLHNDVSALLRGHRISENAEIARYQRLYYENYHAIAAGMDFFLTDDSFVGWGRPGCREGDTIFLVPGSNAPIVLREEDEGFYRLIGDAYVHGIMYGEAFEEHREFEDINVK
jgi:hypothetical protein